MKAFLGLVLVGLVSAGSAATHEDEHAERKRKLAEMGHNMSRHLRKDHSDSPQMASAHVMRQTRESDRGAAEGRPSVGTEESAAHAEKIRRVAEQLSEHHRLHKLHMQESTAKDVYVHSAQHSLADVGKREMKREPIADSKAAKIVEKKHAMQQLAGKMSIGFEPRTAGHQPTLKGAPGVEGKHEGRAIRQAFDHASAPIQAKIKDAPLKDVRQQKFGKAARQKFPAVVAKGEVDEAAPANDGDE